MGESLALSGRPAGGWGDRRLDLRPAGAGAGAAARRAEPDTGEPSGLAAGLERPGALILPPIDHLVWGGRDLEAEIDRLERRTGVRAALGGRHPGEGTRNALLRAGRGIYLELIAPDPGQPAPPHPRWFGLDALEEPRLVTWAVRSHALEQRRAEALAAGLSLGAVRSGRRELGAGRALAWQLTYPDLQVGDGLVPFLIDWSDGAHPARTAPAGLELVGLHAEHPAPDSIAELLAALGLTLRVIPAPGPALVATFLTPRGRVELR